MTEPGGSEEEGFERTDAAVRMAMTASTAGGSPPVAAVRVVDIAARHLLGQRPERPGDYLAVVRDGAPPEWRLLTQWLVIGRSRSCDLRIADTFVSGRHAVLDRRDAFWVAEDLGSANGLWLNGQRVTGPVVLIDGDHMVMGDVILVFARFVDEDFA